MSYNGWKNYETWIVNMEFVGDCELDVFLDPSDLFSEVEEDDRVSHVSNILEDQFEEHIYANVGNSLLLTLLRAASDEVDWDEIAQHLVDNWVQEHPESLVEISD